MSKDDRPLIPALPRDIALNLRRVCSDNFNGGALTLPGGGIIRDIRTYLKDWAIAYLTSTSQDGRDDALKRITTAVEACRDQGYL